MVIKIFYPSYKNYIYYYLYMIDKPYRIYNKYLLNKKNEKKNKYKIIKSIDSNIFPKKIDLRNEYIEIYDQGNIGSCTANALLTCFEYHNCNFKGSRLFLYYNSRLFDNDLYNDNGSTLKTGINVLKKFGICNESLYQYDENNFKIIPHANAYINAQNNKVIIASQLNNDINSIKLALTKQKLIAVSIILYKSFELNNVSETGIVQMPNINSEILLGGHSVVCMGYDDTNKHFIMLNSWGKDWGDNGYFYLPYNYLINPNLADELWTIDKIKII